MAQTSLAWLNTKSWVTSPIIGATSLDQLNDSLASHHQHIARFQKTRQIVWASLLKETKELTALVFFREGTLYDARKIMEQDPAVQSKLLRYEIFEWMSEDLVMPW